MTEADWRACEDPKELLRFLERGVSSRKMGLFVLAGCDRLWGSRTEDGIRLTLDLLTEVIWEGNGRSATQVSLLAPGRAVLDCGASDPTLWAINPSGVRERFDQSVPSPLVSLLDLLACTQEFAWRKLLLPHIQENIVFYLASGGLPLPVQADLCRDIFRGPFRPLVFRNTWRTLNGGTTRHLGELIYRERSFDELPFLADALIDAGCEEPEILDHLRSSGPHVRGCWVLDLVVAKG
jgi:hypothetical protein